MTDLLELSSELTELQPSWAKHYVQCRGDRGRVELDLSSREARDMLHIVKELKVKTQSHVTESGKEIEEQWVTVKLHDVQKAAIEILKLADLYAEDGPTVDVQVDVVVEQMLDRLGIQNDGLGYQLPNGYGRVVDGFS